MNFTGVWQANIEKSVFRGPAPKRLLNRIEHREPELIQEMIVTQASGDEQRVVFRYLTNGEETTNSIGGATATTRARWVGAELVIESALDAVGHTLSFKDHWSLSEDGQTLTMAHRDDALTGQIVVHDKGPDAVIRPQLPRCVADE